ncbi:hypothetical protein COBT_000465 [Conglomerata obtusa]
MNEKRQEIDEVSTSESKHDKFDEGKDEIIKLTESNSDFPDILYDLETNKIDQINRNNLKNNAPNKMNYKYTRIIGKRQNKQGETNSDDALFIFSAKRKANRLIPQYQNKIQFFDDIFCNTNSDLYDANNNNEKIVDGNKLTNIPKKLTTIKNNKKIHFHPNVYDTNFPMQKIFNDNLLQKEILYVDKGIRDKYGAIMEDDFILPKEKTLQNYLFEVVNAEAKLLELYPYYKPGLAYIPTNRTNYQQTMDKTCQIPEPHQFESIIKFNDENKKGKTKKRGRPSSFSSDFASTDFDSKGMKVDYESGGIDFKDELFIDYEHPENKDYICPEPECKKTFPSLSRAKRHYIVHTGHKPYKCLNPECPKSFSRKDNMLQHYNKHCSARKRVKKD